MLLSVLYIVLLVAALLTAPGIWNRRDPKRPDSLLMALGALILGCGMLLIPAMEVSQPNINEKVVIEVTTPYHE